MAFQSQSYGAEFVGKMYQVYKSGASVPINFPGTIIQPLASYSIVTAIGTVVGTIIGTDTATATASATATNGTITNTVITTATATFTATSTVTTTFTATATASASAADPKTLAQYVITNFYDNNTAYGGSNQRTDLIQAIETIIGLYDGNI